MHMSRSAPQARPEPRLRSKNKAPHKRGSGYYQYFVIFTETILMGMLVTVKLS